MQNWDINLLRRSTPKCRSRFWMGISNSAYVAGVGVPARHVCNRCYIQETKTKINSYEDGGQYCICCCNHPGAKGHDQSAQAYESMMMFTRQVASITEIIPSSHYIAFSSRHYAGAGI